MKKTAVTALLALAIPAQGAWTLIEDFESGNSFSGGTVVTAGGSSVISVGDGNTAHTNNLVGSEVATDGQTSTFFYQIFVPTGNLVDSSAGLKESSIATTNWGDYGSQVGFVDAGGNNEVRVRNGNGAGGGGFASEFSPYAEGSFINVWQVLDLSANNYDVFIEGAGTGGQIQIVDDYGFRNTTNPGAFDQIMLKTGGAPNSLTTYYDNFYMSQGVIDLTNPVIPEPSSLGLLALAGLGLMGRRRK